MHRVKIAPAIVAFALGLSSPLPTAAQEPTPSNGIFMIQLRIVGPDSATGTRPVTVGCATPTNPAAEQVIDLAHDGIETVDFGADLGIAAGEATDCWAELGGAAERAGAIALTLGDPVWHATGAPPIRYSLSSLAVPPDVDQHHTVWFWSASRVAATCSLDEQMLAGRSIFEELKGDFVQDDHRLEAGDAIHALHVAASGIVADAETSSAPSVLAMAGPAAELISLAEELWDQLAPTGIYLRYVAPEDVESIQLTAGSILARLDQIEAAQELSCAAAVSPAAPQADLVAATPTFTG